MKISLKISKIKKLAVEHLQESSALPIFEVFVLIVLVVNFSLSQALLIFLLYMKQTRKTQLILTISLWGIMFFSFKRILLLLCMVLKVMWRRDILFLFLYFIYFFKPLENSCWCFGLALLHLVSPSYSLCTVFQAISFKIDKVLSMNPFCQCICISKLQHSSRRLVNLFWWNRYTWKLHLKLPYPDC